MPRSDTLTSAASEGVPAFAAVRHAGVALAYLALGIVYTWPLARTLGTTIASDPYDPVLNASVLWWNAVHLPFSGAWWNAPHFYPSSGVAAFTENLAGISLIASPVYWATHNPLTAYNVAFILTWPLSAIAVYLLVHRLAGRADAAFVAGLAYAFTPYRADGLAHIQTLSSYWIPLALLGLHGYLEQRRRWWLVLFGVAWLFQSLANGYYMLFGVVLIALWLAWFASHASTWRVIPAILAVWMLASLPLVPVLLRYRAIHDRLAMHREMHEVLAFSATPQSFLRVTGAVASWRHVLPSGSDNLFPGATVLALMAAAWLVAWWPRRGNQPAASAATRGARALLTMIVVLGIAALLAILTLGPLDVEWRGIPIRMRSLDRTLLWTAVSGAALIWITPRARAAITTRSAFAFYGAATMVMAILACGPVVTAAGQGVLSPAPYAWLMALPGFNELRVPSRFWMLGELCLCTAAGLAFARLRPPGTTARAALVVVVAAAVWLDGRLAAMPVAAAPARWGAVEPTDVTTPILELPLGPDTDASATFRTIFHGRRVINGVSGYDPPHYAPLKAGLNQQDPAMLSALASLTAFDIVVNGESDSDGDLARYAAEAPGATLMARDGPRTLFRVPKGGGGEPRLGAAWPIAGVQAFRHDARVVWDGRVDTEWGDMPQRAGQWFVIDLGAVHPVAGITHALGRYARDFPRRLAIDVSVDGSRWNRVWEGSTAAPAFLAAVRGPGEASMRLAFPPREARYVRLEQLADDPDMWRLAEITVHAP